MFTAFVTRGGGQAAIDFFNDLQDRAEVARTALLLICMLIGDAVIVSQPLSRSTNTLSSIETMVDIPHVACLGAQQLGYHRPSLDYRDTYRWALFSFCIQRLIEQACLSKRLELVCFTSSTMRAPVRVCSLQRLVAGSQATVVRLYGTSIVTLPCGLEVKLT